MITRPLDTIFHSADRIRDAGAILLVHIPAEGRLHRSVVGLMAALDQFDAALAIGSREPAAVTAREDDGGAHSAAA
jgi:hypothetical protein